MPADSKGHVRNAGEDACMCVKQACLVQAQAGWGGTGAKRLIGRRLICSNQGAMSAIGVTPASK